jgi:hypothetical protein
MRSTTTTLATLILSLMGCTEYSLEGPQDEPDDKLPRDSEPFSPPLGELVMDTQPPPPDEECNGVDDDGDGLVDEGFDDVDGDGIADCVDEDCELGEHPGGEVELLESCSGEPIPVVKDPWSVDIEWQYTSGRFGVIVMPSVGNLSDDNGDGRIDEDDTPDIVITEGFTGELIALHGDGSGELFRLEGFSPYAGTTIADVDQDGVPEVVALTDNNEVTAVHGDGTLAWQSRGFGLSGYPQPAVADLDADGVVEVVFDTAVVSGLDGSTLFQLGGVGSSWRTPVLADIDADGTQEIIIGEEVFDHTGVPEWRVGSSGQGNFAAVADLDGDIGGEVVFVSGQKMYLFEPDGTPIDTVAIPGSNPGPPSVADFDGDGEVEIALPANTSISMWDSAGTMIWSSPISDASGLAGCSGYDIDGDGAYELLYADEDTFRIYDGATGTELYSNGSHGSGTLWEYPVTADVDGDGSAEIIIASNGQTWQGITVFGHSGSGWQASGPTWGTHDFAVTNLEADGSIPSPAPLSWTVHNVFRARPVVDDGGAADLEIAIEDACVASCEHGPIRVSFAVSNQGALDVPSGVIATLYTLDGATELAVDKVTIDAVPAGTVIHGGIFELHPDDQGPDGLLLRIDDDGAGHGVITECDESNNEFEFGDGFCGR